MRSFEAWFATTEAFQDEQRADIYEAFTSLAASLVNLNQIKRLC